MHDYWLKGLGISLRSAGSAVSGVSWTYYALVIVFGFMLPALIPYELQKYIDQHGTGTTYCRQHHTTHPRICAH